MIYVDNRQEKIDVNDDIIRGLEDTIAFALEEEEVTIPCEVSLVFVDNEEIKEINKENRGIDRVTDVLSFPMLDYPERKVYKECYKDKVFDETFMDGDQLVLGDIVLSLEKAEEQGKEYNHSFQREASYLVVHSVLHLLGYDHMDEEEKKIMRRREEEILDKLNIKRI
ncbi:MULTISPECIES: rRNA maturation RNase YbeY [Clostridium]|uniref:Endoribonuclease YbeY n=1 Tax=Clostridium cibarium TaxID=2762247 RepID=A0ABR8PNM8_9CLOT|nr:MULTISPECIES: rRNA maturation RNase YbeY [Clostridium]MBD7909784.1 rRNA maturation RNase YbeY [Clostridium cibarium]